MREPTSWVAFGAGERNFHILASTVVRGTECIPLLKEIPLCLQTAQHSTLLLSLAEKIYSVHDVG
jgi:hypothetical protein